MQSIYQASLKESKKENFLPLLKETEFRYNIQIQKARFISNLTKNDKK